MIDKRKVVIIGAGHVGAHCAMAIAFQGTADEIVLLDKDKDKAYANALDIADACLFLPTTTKIKCGGYSDCSDADVIVISIGTPRLPGQTRLDMLDDAVAELKDVCSNLLPINYKGIIITITNPADIIADYTRKALNMPRERCFSTGTSLDTARLKRIIGELADVDRKSIASFSMGEHGNSSIIPFSSTAIGGADYKKLRSHNPKRYGKLKEDCILERTRQTGNEIIDGKGSTEFGIGAALADILKSIFHDEKRIIPVSVLLEGEYNQHNVHAGVPCVIGKNGVEDIIELPLSAEENKQFEKTCGIIKQHIERATSL